MRRLLLLIASLSSLCAQGAYAEPRPLVDMVDAALSRVVRHHIEPVAPDVAWSKLVSAMRATAAASASFESCVANFELRATRRTKSSERIAAMVDCGAPTDKREDFVVASLKSFLADVDKDASLLSPDVLRQMMGEGSAEGGLGVSLTKKDKITEIVWLHSESPLRALGAGKGDHIETIDEQSLSMLQLGDIIKLLQGPVGSSVVLSIRKSASGQLQKFETERQLFEAENFQIEQRGKSLIVSLQLFGLDSAAELREELLLPQWRSAERLVIDLRYNTGGIEEEVFLLADLFINKGELFTVVEQNPVDKFRRFATKGDVWNGRPITILVDGTTENGAEIFAAAMQDRKRAKIVGQNTPGLVVIQTVFPLPRDHALRLTTSSVFRADNGALRGVGVKPDIVWTGTVSSDTPDSETQDPLLEYALSLP
jgi:carboxyl-terminal processing protease